MLNFPNSPTNGQESAQPNNVIYIWDAALQRWDADRIINGIFIPIGTVYLTVGADKPSDVFNYGTWEFISQSRTLIGEGSGAGLTQRDLNDEGGVEDSVTSSHTHGLGGHNHSGTGNTSGSNHQHTLNGRYFTTPNDHDVFKDGTDDGDLRNGTANSSGSTHSHNATINSRSGTSGANADEEDDTNPQPYVVVNMWARTA